MSPNPVCVCFTLPFRAIYGPILQVISLNRTQSEFMAKAAPVPPIGKRRKTFCINGRPSEFSITRLMKTLSESTSKKLARYYLLMI